MQSVPKIEIRNVHEVGDGGLSIVLPISWAREKNLEKGSKVLVIADDKLIVEPSDSERIEDAHEIFEKFIQRD